MERGSNPSTKVMVTWPRTPKLMQQHSGTSKKNVKVISSVLLGSWAGTSVILKSSGSFDVMQKQVVVVLVLVDVLALVDVLVLVDVVVVGGGAGAGCGRGGVWGIVTAPPTSPPNGWTLKKKLPWKKSSGPWKRNYFAIKKNYSTVKTWKGLIFRALEINRPRRQHASYPWHAFPSRWRSRCLDRSLWRSLWPSLCLALPTPEVSIGICLGLCVMQARICVLSVARFSFMAVQSMSWPQFVEVTVALLVFCCPRARGVYWNLFGTHRVLQGSKMLLTNYSLHEHHYLLTSYCL